MYLNYLLYLYNIKTINMETKIQRAVAIVGCVLVSIGFIVQLSLIFLSANS